MLAASGLLANPNSKCYSLSTEPRKAALVVRAFLYGAAAINAVLAASALVYGRWPAFFVAIASGFLLIVTAKEQKPKR